MVVVKLCCSYLCIYSVCFLRLICEAECGRCALLIVGSWFLCLTFLGRLFRWGVWVVSFRWLIQVGHAVCDAVGDLWGWLVGGDISARGVVARCLGFNVQLAISGDSML